MKVFRVYILPFIFIMLPFYLFSQQINDTIVLKGVEIKDSLIKKLPFAASEINKMQLNSISSHDIGELLRSVPNVSSIRKGGASLDPVIRGFKFSQLTTILDNGIKIENGCPNRMDPVTAHVEAEDIEKIEIIKGPFVLRYGPSFGGVIDMVTEDPHPYDTFQIHASAMYGFETNWNGQKEHISINGGNKKIYFLVSGGYRNYGNYESGNLEGHDTTFSSSFKKFNYTAKLGFSPNCNNSILASYRKISGRDVLYPALPMDEKADDTQIMSVDYCGKNLGNNFRSIDAKIYCSIVDHLMDNSHRAGYSAKQMVASVDAINMGGRIESSLQFNDHRIRAGMDFENIMKDGNRTMTMQMMGMTSSKMTNLWYNADISNTGLYAQYNYLFSSYEINASLRMDYNSASSDDTLKIIKNDIDYFNNTSSRFFNFSATFAITKKINEYFNVSLAAGRGTRSPNMLERFIKLMAVGYDNYDYLGNPSLKPEINNEADLTFKFEKNNFGSFYLNGFYSVVQDYISASMLPSSVITPQTQGVLGVKQFVNVNYVTFRGFELGYASDEKFNFGGGVTASYTYSVIPSVIKYIYTGTNISGNVMLENDALPEIPPLEASLNIYYKFMKNKLIPKFSARLVADQRHVSEASYEPYTPGFGLLDFSVTSKINSFVSINAGVNNIFDRAYYEHLNRKIIGTSGKLYEPGRVFFVNLFLNI